MSLLEDFINLFKEKGAEYFYDKFKEKLSEGKDLTEEELQKAIGKGFDVNAKDSYGHTLCMYAAACDRTETMRVLKELGADVNAKDEYDRTACMYAAINGYTETVRVLVEELKADINAQDNDGKTACMHAAWFGKTETMLELVKMGADISIKDNDGDTLFDYIDDETMEEVIKLRKEYEGNHPEAKKMAASFAARYFYDKFEEKVLDGENLTKEELEKAVSLGFDVNARDIYGWTACMLAAINGRTKTVRVLVEELDADIDAQDENGYTACMWAARNGHTETMFDLVRLGADISIKDNNACSVFDHISVRDFYINRPDGEDIETKKKIIELRREYEENHPDKPKMADDLAKMYLPKVVVEPVPVGPHTAQTKGAIETTVRGRVPQK